MAKSLSPVFVAPGKCSLAERVAAVKYYAMARYGVSGWDFVVESLTDSEIISYIAGCETRWGAIDKMSFWVKLWAERRSEVMAEAF